MEKFKKGKSSKEEDVDRTKKLETVWLSTYTVEMVNKYSIHSRVTNMKN